MTIRIATYLGFVVLSVASGAANAQFTFTGKVTGTYIATLATESQTFQLDADRNAEQIISFQESAGALGFTFTDSLGDWKRDYSGPRRVSMRVVNFNFNTATSEFTGTAVVDYTLDFAANFKSFSADCDGVIYAPGIDPFDPNSPTTGTIDCDNLANATFVQISAQ